MRPTFVWRRYLIALSAAIAIVLATGLTRPAGACVACASGTHVGCEEGNHKAWTSEVDAVWAGEGHETCKCCTCTASHGSCSLVGLTYEQALESVSGAIAQNDPVSLATLAGQTDSRIVLNTQRSAVQVMSCNRVTVMASLPVMSPLLAAATAALAPPAPPLER